MTLSIYCDEIISWARCMKYNMRQINLIALRKSVKLQHCHQFYSVFSGKPPGFHFRISGRLMNAGLKRKTASIEIRARAHGWYSRERTHTSAPGHTHKQKKTHAHSNNWILRHSEFQKWTSHTMNLKGFISLSWLWHGPDNLGDIRMKPPHSAATDIDTCTYRHFRLGCLHVDTLV